MTPLRAVIANSMSGTGKLAMKLRPTVSAWRSRRVQRNFSAERAERLRKRGMVLSRPGLKYSEWR